MLNSGEAKILNFSRPGSLRDATLALFCMGCEGGNPDIKWLRLMISAYIASMNVTILYLFLDIAQPICKCVTCPLCIALWCVKCLWFSLVFSCIFCRVLTHRGQGLYNCNSSNNPDKISSKRRDKKGRAGSVLTSQDRKDGWVDCLALLAILTELDLACPKPF